MCSISIMALSMPPRAGTCRTMARPAGLHVPLGSRLDEAERSLIEVTLDYCEGDKRRAAAVLGCSLKTLYNKLNSYARGAHGWCAAAWSDVSR